MSETFLFEAKNISKNFSGNVALKDVNMQIKSGEIVGLVGENGAGKSTLLKIVIGCQPQSSGTMIVSGQEYAPKNPKEANQNGIGMVFQEQSLVTNLTVGQNIFFGNEKKFSRFGLINYKKMYEAAEEVLGKINMTGINPAKKVGELNFATRQMVEIAKVINQAQSSGCEHSIILLDEPTSVLNDAEIKQLFSEMRKLALMGHSIIFVSHRLNEVLEISDRIYVFKDAAKVGEMYTSQADEAILYEMMVGRASSNEYYKLEEQINPQNEVMLEVNNLGLFGVFKDVSFKLHNGEILGICGVVGSGKEEICSVLCGDQRQTAGNITIKGKKINFTSPYKALNKSILLVPKERNEESIVPILNIADNIALSSYHELGKYGMVSNKKLIQQAKEWISLLRIKTESYKTSLMQLSGGNAQKVVFARILASSCDILILNHPTRGVDVGAKEEIYHLIREIAKQGKSIILLGDTLDECIGLSNLILVMKDGLITGEFDASVCNKPDQVSVAHCMM